LRSDHRGRSSPAPRVAARAVHRSPCLLVVGLRPTRVRRRRRPRGLPP
jgi:hypothetical protein